MALSLDDKLLGEKVHNYCSSSSSEDDGESTSENDSNDEIVKRSNAMSEKVPLNKNEMFGTVPGYSLNTGPKGVMEDWRRYKQLEAHKRSQEEAEVRNLYRNMSLASQPDKEERKNEKENEDEFRELFENIDGLDELFEEYREKRMNEMRQIYLNLPTFESVLELDAQSFVPAIDTEHAQITVIVHLYEPGIEPCSALNGCLVCLAQLYPHIKFCRMRASLARMSSTFLEKALPALVVYRGGELIGNLIQIDKYLGDDFFVNELEAFLLQYGFIPDKSTDLKCNLSTIRQIESDKNDDYDID